MAGFHYLRGSFITNDGNALNRHTTYHTHSNVLDDVDMESIERTLTDGIDVYDDFSIDVHEVFDTLEALNNFLQEENLIP